MTEYNVSSAKFLLCTEIYANLFMDVMLNRALKLQKLEFAPLYIGYLSSFSEKQLAWNKAQF